uniref:Uncharacterized protein n=1 Tax=Panagrolaimus superbus TaxID=310955 RepID=A0A914YPA1_9BILA
MFRQYTPQKMKEYYKSGLKLRQKKLDSYQKMFIIRSLGGLAFLQNDAFSSSVIDQLGNQLKVREIIYLLPKKRAKLRRQISKRAMEFSLNNSTMFVIQKSIKLTKIEKRFFAAIKKLHKNGGYLFEDIQFDLLLLALIFEQLYQGGFPTNSDELLNTVIQLKNELQIIKITASNVPTRLCTIKAHIESLLCLMDTATFKKVHHCRENCHTFPSIFSTLPPSSETDDQLNTTQNSIYSLSPDEFFLPSFHFISNPEIEQQFCKFSLHPPFPLGLLSRIRQSISQLITVEEKYQFQAWKFFQGFCNPLTCVRGYGCESPLHLLKQLENCYFGAKVLLFTVEAFGKNICFASMMKEIEASGKFEFFNHCYLQILSDSK